MYRAGTLFCLVILGASGCAAYGGETPLTVSTRVIAHPGFEVRSPVALKTPNGVRFHGAVCRNTVARLAATIHLDRVGAGGKVLASASQRLDELAGRTRRCIFYDLSTDWALTPQDHINVCVQSAASSCGPA